MANYRERFTKALGDSTSIRQVAQSLGVSYQAVKKVADGKSAAFTAENNAKVSKFLGIDPNWLATGQGQMRADEQQLAAAAVNEFAFLTAKLKQLDHAARERAAVLLQGLARDPEGPWAAWLTELLAAPAQATQLATTPIVKEPFHYKKINQLT